MKKNYHGGNYRKSEQQIGLRNLIPGGGNKRYIKPP